MQAPQNIEAEQALLGAILINNSSYNRVAEFLAPAHFHEPIHQRIYEIIETLQRADVVVTPVTVRNHLQEKVGDLDLAKYLANLAGQATSIINATDFGRTVYDLALRRRLMSLGGDLLEESGDMSDPTISGYAIAERAVGSLVGLMHAQAGPSANLSTRQLADRTLRLASEAKESGHQRGLLFDFLAVDELIGPVLPGQLVVLGGDTKMGKTALAVQLGYMMAKQGHTVGVRSLEMPPPEVNDRLVSALADINAETLRTAEWTPGEGDRLQRALIELDQVPLWISGKGRESIDAFRSWAVNMKKYKNAKLLVADHLRFIDVPTRRDKFEKIGEAVLAVKDIAVQLDIAILLCTQLNRLARPDSYTRKGCIGRPSLSHLYGASEIEQTADAVLFVHRPEHYLRMIEPPVGAGRARDDWDAEMLVWTGRAELICAARRAGASFQVRTMDFNAKRTWFGPYYALHETQHGML